MHSSLCGCTAYHYLLITRCDCLQVCYRLEGDRVSHAAQTKQHRARRTQGGIQVSCVCVRFVCNITHDRMYICFAHHLTCVYVCLLSLCEREKQVYSNIALSRESLHETHLSERVKFLSDQLEIVMKELFESDRSCIEANKRAEHVINSSSSSSRSNNSSSNSSSGSSSIMYWSWRIRRLFS